MGCFGKQYQRLEYRINAECVVLMHEHNISIRNFISVSHESLYNWFVNAYNGINTPAPFEPDDFNILENSKDIPWFW